MKGQRRKVILAFLGSLLVHVFALVVFAIVVALQPPTPEAQAKEDDPLKLEMVAAETPPPEPDLAAMPTPTPPRKNIHIADTRGMDEADSPPPDKENAEQSDRNTRASNSGAVDAAGQAVPTQAGSRQMAHFQFNPDPVAATPEPRPTPQPQTAPERPRPARQAAAATPVPTAAPDEFALLSATPTPPPEDPFDPSVRSTSPPLPHPAMKKTPSPRVSSASDTLQVSANGSISNHGTGAVDSVATPTGRYAHQVKEMIRFMWNRAFDANGDIGYGEVVIHITINSAGQVTNAHVLSNTANDILASVSLQAVVDTHLPPIPPEVIEENNDPRFSMNITFNCLQ